MKARAVELLSQLGYSIGAELNIHRAFAFNAVKNGRTVKIGIRAGSDRWMAVTMPSLTPGGELVEVDEVILITFADPKTRQAIELWSFAAPLIADVAQKVFAAAGTTGQQWLPLDDALDAEVHSMVAGSLRKHGKLLIAEPVNWVEDTQFTAEKNIHEGGELFGATKLTIAEAKAGLAAQFGVSPDSIKITIEG
jgi:hypothetical protein